MKFAPDNNVCIIPFEMLQQHGNTVWIDIHSRIQKRDHIAFRAFHPKPDCISFPVIFLVPNYGKSGGFHFLRVLDGFIDKTINNDNDFVLVTDFTHRVEDSLQVGLDGLFLRVCGYNDGNKRDIGLM